MIAIKYSKDKIRQNKTLGFSLTLVLKTFHIGQASQKNRKFSVSMRRANQNVIQWSLEVRLFSPLKPYSDWRTVNLSVIWSYSNGSLLLLITTVNHVVDHDPLIMKGINSKINQEGKQNLWFTLAFCPHYVSIWVYMVSSGERLPSSSKYLDYGKHYIKVFLEKESITIKTSKYHYQDLNN